eukprot:568616-Hanusia_phi.AAC.1
MAPESIARRQYTDKSDVWAFGVTMWEMWTYGQVPYGAITDDEMVGQRVGQGLRLTAPSVCPAGVYEVMQACWRERKNERPSFSELKGLLRQQYDLQVHREAAHMCVICLEQEAQFAMVSCGHRCLCAACKEMVGSIPCPICRRESTGVIRIF